MEVIAPVATRVAHVAVEPGTAVATGEALVVLEVMKMQHPVRAVGSGVVAAEAGSGLNVAMAFEIDDVIDPADSRRWITNLLL